MNFEEITDEAFDDLYPIKIKMLSKTHWTPVAVIRKAMAYLNENGGKSILDLGSGAGKFCLVAALISDATITGVEQRENLVQLSRKFAHKYDLTRAFFIHEDLKNLDFTAYDGFYFFNAFEENINLTDKLHQNNQISQERYALYIRLIRRKFDELPNGCRIVTYCGDATEIPESYLLIKSGCKGKLRFWEKRG